MWKTVKKQRGTSILRRLSWQPFDPWPLNPYRKRTFCKCRQFQQEEALGGFDLNLGRCDDPQDLTVLCPKYGVHAVLHLFHGGPKHRSCERVQRVGKLDAYSTGTNLLDHVLGQRRNDVIEVRARHVDVCGPRAFPCGRQTAMKFFGIGLRDPPYQSVSLGHLDELQRINGDHLCLRWKCECAHVGPLDPQSHLAEPRPLLHVLNRRTGDW
mmetsp:Transcript_25230/g.66118  ORF Transcript_25230/g.66118 Transcript_25230/m.66118 type:complete len:211 (+) Transcript_25230:546-1178(+)